MNMFAILNPFCHVVVPHECFASRGKKRDSGSDGKRRNQATDWHIILIERREEKVSGIGFEDL